MTAPAASPWFHPILRRPAARARLICFPHAGSGMSAMRRWGELLPPAIEVIGVQLPGRETRLREPPLTSIEEILDALEPAARELLSGEFAFFGHSMGSLVAFELARRRRAAGDALPSHLFVSGHQAPQFSPRTSRYHELPTPELRRQLAEMGGIPAVLLENEEFMELLVPLMRADLAVCENYQCAPAEPLPCPITVFGGLADAETTLAGLDAWREQTSGSFDRRMLPGGHFFVYEQEHLVLRVVAQAMLPSGHE